jgi:hypothetical protein
MQIESLGRAGAGRLAIVMGLLALGACGGDDDKSPAPSGGSAGAGGSASTALPAHTAGKACSADADCEHGSCSHQLPDTNAVLGTTGMETAPDGYCTTGCYNTTECGTGGTCIGATTTASGGNGTRGLCYAACSSSADCRDGYRCIGSLGTPLTTPTATPVGTCQVAPATDKLAPGVVGSMCGADTDCSGGSCTMTGIGVTFPGGYCSGRCLADSDCGSTGVCNAGLGGAAGTCYRKCDSDSDCARDGYRCRAPATIGMADPNAVKQCVAGAKPLADGVVGSACLADGDCGGAAMSCRAQTAAIRGMAFPGGYCTQGCADDSDCGAGGVCTGGFAGVATGTCYKTCTAASDCRDGYSCSTPPSAFGIGAGAGAANSPTVCGPSAPTGEDAGVP